MEEQGAGGPEHHLHLIPLSHEQPPSPKQQEEQEDPPGGADGGAGGGRPPGPWCAPPPRLHQDSLQVGAAPQVEPLQCDIQG